MKASQNVRTSRGKNRLIFKNTCLNRLKSTAVKRALTSSILPRVNTCCTYSSRSAGLARSKEALSLRNQNNFLSGKIFIGYVLRQAITHPSASHRSPIGRVFRVHFRSLWLHLFLFFQHLPFFHSLFITKFPRLIDVELHDLLILYRNALENNPHESLDGKIGLLIFRARLQAKQEILCFLDDIKRVLFFKDFQLKSFNILLQFTFLAAQQPCFFLVNIEIDFIFFVNLIKPSLLLK